MRIENDSLGEMQIPDEAYYGIQTARALTNFPISGLTAHPSLVESMVYIKKAAALTNHELGRLDKDRKDVIVKACDEILKGNFIDQFLVNIFQMGDQRPR